MVFHTVNVMISMAVLDSCKLGRTLLTFLIIDTCSYQATRTFLQFTSRKEVEELPTAAGDGCVFIKVRAADTESLEITRWRFRVLRVYAPYAAILRFPYFWSGLRRIKAHWPSGVR